MPNQSERSAGDRAGAAEQQDQRKADHEGRRDDRQHAQDAQEPLVPEARAGRDEREGKAERRRPDADEKAEKERVPGDPAAQLRGQAVEAPDRPVAELGDELAEREIALVVLDRADQDRRDGKEDEDRNECDDDADRRHDEGIAAAQAPRRKSMAEQDQKRRRRQRRAVSHAAPGSVPGCRIARRESPTPAVEADREALHERAVPAPRAGGDEAGRALRTAIAGTAAAGRGGAARQRQQPGAPEARHAESASAEQSAARQPAAAGSRDARAGWRSR